MSHTAPGIDRLHSWQPTALHRAAPEVKLVGLVVFVLAVVATPIHQAWAFAGHALVVAAAVATARLPVRTLARRLRIEVPFLAFAMALPFVGHGPTVAVAGLHLSQGGLWGAADIIAKATLGTTAAIVLAWSTPVADLLAGLERLRVPKVLVAIAGFMVRYLDVITHELRRLDVARTSRGDDPRWLWQGRAVASTAGTLFIRSYERGERVHQAMVARGFDGTFPATAAPRRARWLPALAWPATSLLLAVAALAVA